MATVLLALEHNEPLDEILFTEVMFDHARNISGEIPEHIDWIHSTAIPRFEAMGVKTRILRSDRDYMYFFQNTVGGGEARRQNLWFSTGRQMHHKPGGFLIFKWNETDIRVSEVLKLTTEKPVFGHISGKRSNTHWICFMKQ